MRRALEIAGELLKGLGIIALVTFGWPVFFLYIVFQMDA